MRPALMRSSGDDVGERLPLARLTRGRRRRARRRDPHDDSRHERRLLRLEALALGIQPVSRMTRWTRSSVDGATAAGLLTARETVAVDMPGALPRRECSGGNA